MTTNDVHMYMYMVLDVVDMYMLNHYALNGDPCHTLRYTHANVHTYVYTFLPD